MAMEPAKLELRQLLGFNKTRGMGFKVGGFVVKGLGA